MVWPRPIVTQAMTIIADSHVFACVTNVVPTWTFSQTLHAYRILTTTLAVLPFLVLFSTIFTRHAP